MGMDWRYGALHFMRHLIDGDCPIDHYQWAMQAGVTHCVDKTWTRIYNPGQAAVDRCDPEGQFIKRWLPELADLPPQQLGNPPRRPTYPAPILDYKAARKRRVAQLERQRQRFLHTPHLLPHLAPLPADLTPFGGDRDGGEIRWAAAPTPPLFPPALDLTSLDRADQAALRTWFVAHVTIPPSRSSRRRPASTGEQLSLLD
jgi:deoxyribodipyrimidine photo-lyase